MTPKNFARRMRLLSTFKIAARALRRNKLRSALTALGIIIGVGTIVAMVGIGNGAKAQVETQVASLGRNVIMVYPGSISSSTASRSSMSCGVNASVFSRISVRPADTISKCCRYGSSRSRSRCSVCR